MATRTKKQPYGRQTLAEAFSAEDVIVHVNTLDVEGIRLVEIREWIPSTGTYGRGIAMPEDTFESLRAGLATA